MKVVCIDNITHNGMKYNLTIGKIYEVEEIDLWQYITDDNGTEDHFIPYLFTPLEKIRLKKINQILQ